ncbi:sigma-54 dependent transcriptional regulator [Anoxynatronum sibiricum]|uniref:Stage 0 sporulation protein A homolog n=1 Tax=Anoxynatronum sibiricum TaxID=210623 RepID=A0ABU9VWZ1_9CLOT
MDKILIVDDEISICSSLTFALEDRFDVQAVTDASQAMQLARQETFHLCLLDLKIGQVNGIDVLEQMKAIQPEMVVIMMTAYASISSSVEAIKKGAYTYLTKPLHMEAMLSVIEQALAYQRLNRQLEYLSSELAEKYTDKGIIGNSPPMKVVFSKIEKLKDLDTSVLVVGESGTGKELVARALHFSGQRRKHRFVALNCAAIPENLLESELFGHRKGAFSGANADKPGKFEYANQGTLFLDEIGDMPLGLQAKLLRVLQQKEVTPLGANRPIPLDVRVIAATNQDLNESVRQGTFRQDLYYRLNVVTVSMPALRTMREDLPLLFRHFLKSFQKPGEPVRKLSEEAAQGLMHYDYPGNIRELGNILEGACIMAEGEMIQWHDLPEEVRKITPIPDNNGEMERDVFSGLVGMTLEEIERKVIEATLASHEGHRQKTAEVLGISERGLRNKINRYSLGTSDPVSR